GDKLVTSDQLEAVVWLRPQEEEADAAFLRDTGVVQCKGEFRVHRGVKALLCRFGKGHGRDKYQALEEYIPVPPGRYPVEPVVVERQSSGLVFRPGDIVRLKGKELELSKLQLQILRVLHEHYPVRVSIDELREGVAKWDHSTSTETITQAVSSLRR